MGSGSVKLFRIASEINIGKDAIVEYLQSKGFDIQNKPTATLTEKMIDVVMEKFKKERRAAEIQREKIQKHKEIRADVVKPHNEKEEKHTTHAESIAVAKPLAEPQIKTEPELPVSVPEVVDIKPVENAKAEIKIEEPLKQPTSELQAKPIEQPKEVKSEIPEIKVETKPEPPKVEVVKQPEIEIPKEVTKETPKSAEPQVKVEEKKHETKPEEKKVEPKQEEPIIEIKEKSEQKEVKHEQETASVIDKAKEPTDTTDPVQIDKPKTEDKPAESEQEQAQVDKRREKRRKKKKPAQPETEPGEAHHLKGLTVLGKIDLTPPAPVKPVKPERRNRGDVKDGEAKPSKFKKRKHIKPADGPGEQSKSSTPTQTPATSGGRVIPGLIREKDRLKATETTDADNKAKFKDKEVKVKEVEKEDRKKRKRKKSIREMISQEEVDRAIKETLSGMDGSAFTSQRAKLRMKKRIEREEKELKVKEAADRDSKMLRLSEFVTTGDLANMMDINTSDIILKCMELGLMVTINQRLDKDTITLIADDYGFSVDFLDEKEIQIVEDDFDDETLLTERPPIVTIMGHVDHGKTSLLDHIRNANVVAGEAGGITQHIGAYQVFLDTGKSITFLDTPGHEAFTAMRARGAQVTDIVILVVAADDSVMPQTIEAISHAKAANVPIVVAINKIDKPDANPDRIRQQLADHAILVEEWGGKYQSVEISAKQGLNIDKLMEKVLIEAEILELKAVVERMTRGIVIESNMKKGWGSTATIIVQKGTLKVGDAFVTGIHSGKVRALLNERENKIEEAGPSTPVMVIGFDGLPEVGDTFIVTHTDSEARDIANERKQLRREQDMRKVRHLTLDQISAQIQIGGVKELNLVIKGDVAGSVEALSDSLLKLSRDEVRVSILHKGVGPITETDVMLASASGAVVIGFNVNPTGKARKAAENELVDVRHYDIIYDCINEVQLALEGLLTPEYKEEITSTVEIRKTFKVSKIGTIAGCFVKSGKILRNDKVRVLRDGLLEFEGNISSLKRGKDDVKEVDTGFECGIQFAGFNDVMEGDIIESFKLIEIKRKFK
ncbi:MAG: translation initiation factor IF-2 [Candidatus Kapabacteria bacterium]|nr:translation initiation factor IF-2 [Ignavibacteriota bacterium]MCW5884415.1 translation initiation factor IF-2 [Candidatus Kapabacteria bacterium]